MNFEISAPSYYSEKCEVDIEIIVMCSEIKEYMSDRNYSEVIKEFDVIPIVAPEDYLKTKPDCRALNMFTKSIGRISIFQKIYYDKYMNGSVDDRKKLTIKCVIEASRMIKTKRGTNFDVKQFEVDLLNFIGYSKEELEKV